MTTLTPRLKLPRPELDEPADAPDAFNDLTDVLDPATVIYATGTIAARPAAGVPGRFYWATDTRTLSYDDGASWSTASGAAPVGTAMPILDVGMLGQNRAGRQLTVADFTSLGLAQPIGLWNLSNLNNLGSDARAFANKGAVPFGVGINGLATTAAVFAGSTSQALYIPDSGAADPYRIKTGSWGCWFRTAKGAGSPQTLLAKYGAGGNAYILRVSGASVMEGFVTDPTSDRNFVGVSVVADDRWHFAVMTYDAATMRIYVDGALEAASGAASGPINSGGAPLNIGGRGADSGTAATEPHYGRVDEAFVTADVLSEEQVRALYAVKLAHTLGVVPTDVRLNVRRRRKGAELAVSDFTTQPLRLYNFTNNSQSDQGSHGIALTWAAGGASVVAGADGAKDGAFGYASGANQQATDAGLPAGTATRSYGCWFKTATVAIGHLMAWGGAIGGPDARLGIQNSAGPLFSSSGGDVITGPFATDGQWHFAVAVEDNAAGDGVRRKLYLDGRLVGGSTVLNAITLTGANRFRIGAAQDASSPFTGQIDAAFVTGYALTAADIAALYAKGSQALAPSPKNVGDHVEAMTATDVLFIGDTLESQFTVDLGVVA